MLDRLNATILAVCPVVGVSGTQGAIRIDYDPAATQAQRDAAAAALAAFDWSQAADDAYRLQLQRGDAQTALTDPAAAYKLDRAVVVLTVDQLNVLREWTVAFKAAVAASTSLANLQTRVAALPNLPDLTYAQARAAILNSITTGAAD